MDERKEQLLREIAESESELADLEKACKSADEEESRLREELESDRNERKKREEGMETLQADHSKMREQLDELTWRQMSVENETAKMSERLDVVKQRLESARLAIGNPVDVEGKLSEVKAKLSACVRERAALGAARSRLECKLCEVHEKLHSMSAGSSRLSRQLLREKERLLRVLKAKTSVVPLLLEQAEEIAFLRERLELECRARSSLELMMEVELTDMQRRVLFESVARDELSVSVNHMEQLQTVLLSEVGLMHSKLSLLLDKQSRLSAPASAASSSPSGRVSGEGELTEMVELAESLEGKIRTAVEASGSVRAANVAGLVEAKQKEVESLEKALNKEMVERTRVEERCTSLEASVAALERRGAEEREARVRYEREMAEQLHALRDLREMLGSPRAR